MGRSVGLLLLGSLLVLTQGLNHNIMGRSSAARSSAAFRLDGANQTRSDEDVLMKKHHPNCGHACDTCDTHYPSDTCYFGDCSDGSGSICWCPGAKVHLCDGYVECTSSNCASYSR